MSRYYDLDFIIKGRKPTFRYIVDITDEQLLNNSLHKKGNNQPSKLSPIMNQNVNTAVVSYDPNQRIRDTRIRPNFIQNNSYGLGALQKFKVNYGASNREQDNRTNVTPAESTALVLRDAWQSNERSVINLPASNSAESTTIVTQDASQSNEIVPLKDGSIQLNERYVEVLDDIDKTAPMEVVLYDQKNKYNSGEHTLSKRHKNEGEKNRDDKMDVEIIEEGETNRDKMDVEIIEEGETNRDDKMDIEMIKEGEKNRDDKMDIEMIKEGEKNEKNEIGEKNRDDKMDIEMIKEGEKNEKNEIGEKNEKNVEYEIAEEERNENAGNEYFQITKDDEMISGIQREPMVTEDEGDDISDDSKNGYKIEGNREPVSPEVKRDNENPLKTEEAKVPILDDGDGSDHDDGNGSDHDDGNGEGNVQYKRSFSNREYTSDDEKGAPKKPKNDGSDDGSDDGSGDGSGDGSDHDDGDGSDHDDGDGSDHDDGDGSDHDDGKVHKRGREDASDDEKGAPKKPCTKGLNCDGDDGGDGSDDRGDVKVHKRSREHESDGIDHDDDDETIIEDLTQNRDDYYDAFNNGKRTKKKGGSTIKRTHRHRNTVKVDKKITFKIKNKKVNRAITFKRKNKKGRNTFKIKNKKRRNTFKRKNKKRRNTFKRKNRK